MPHSNRSSSEVAPFLARTLVIIPALNEAPCIADTVRYWLRRGAAGVRVADNGSTDDTAKLAADAGAEIVRETRRGYGAACWTGNHQPVVAETTPATLGCARSSPTHERIHANAQTTAVS